MRRIRPLLLLHVPTLPETVEPYVFYKVFEKIANLGLA
jgi:hypothetical protein